MQSNGENGGILTKSPNGKEREIKDITGPDKEESKCPTVSDVSRATKKEDPFSKATTAKHNNPDLGQSGVSRSKRRLSEANQLSTLENINNDHHISSKNNNHFKGHPEFCRWSVSSGNEKQYGKCSDNSGTERKTSKIPSSADSSDVQQRVLNLNRNKYSFTPDQSLPDLLTHGGKQSNREPVLVIKSTTSSSTSDGHPPGCFKSEHDDTVDSSFNGGAILVEAGVSNADVLDTDNNNGESTNLSEETSQQGPSADLSDVQQNFLNLNSYKYVSSPDQSLPDLSTPGSKQSNSEQLPAINCPPSSSAADDHPPGFKSEHDDTTKSSFNGLSILVQVGDSKADVLDTVKDKGESTDPSQQTSHKGPSGDPTVVQEQGHANIVEAGGKAPSADSNAELQNVPEAHDALNYFESLNVTEMNVVNPEQALLKKKYRNKFGEHSSYNSDNNQFNENSSEVLRSCSDSRSGKNSESNSICLSKKNIHQSQQGNNRQNSKDTRNKTIGESASSVVQPLNANLQDNLKELRAHGSNTKQQDSNKLVERCVELENLVKMLQCDNDLMKKEVEGLRLRNGNLENENVNSKKSLEGSLQLIGKCDALVVPVIKELQNKEPLWKAIVRYATGKTLMSDNIPDKIGHICDYAKTVTNKIIDLTNELKEKDVTIDYLRNQVTNVQSEMKKSDEKFKKKSAQQLQIIEETDTARKNELEAKKNIEDKLKASAECIKKYKNKLKYYEGQSEVIELLQQDLHKKSQTINDLEMHSELLQNILKNAGQQLQYYNEQIKSTHGELQTAERNFCQHFDSFKTGMTTHNKMLSLEENSKQAEKNFIDHAVQRIIEIKKNAARYELQIKEFEGNRESKTYLDIKEKLQRRIQELDNVESQKRVEILTARKEAVNYITTLGADLERKVVRC